MKVLFVTTNNYPFKGTCSNILSNIFFDGKLKDNIEKIAVLSAKQKIDDVDEEIIDSINVFRAFSWNLVHSLELKRCLHLRTINKFVCGFIHKAFWYICRHYLGRDFFDVATSASFYKALKKYNAEKFDIIISISGRYEASIAVDKFSKKYHKKFILYQVDPLSTNKVYNKKTILQRKKIEQSLYLNASKILVTPIIFQEHQNDDFSIFSNKMSPLEFPVVKPKTQNPKRNNPLRCIFLGSFYGNIRKPDYTIELFKDAFLSHEITLEFVGNIDDSLKKYEKKYPIKCWGQKSIATCQQIMQQADVLINVGNSIDNQIPSKIFEYISTGKPIVNVCKIKECPTLQYMSRYSSSINFFEDDLLLASQRILLNSFLRNLPPIIESDKILEEFRACTPKFVAEIILKNL